MKRFAFVWLGLLLASLTASAMPAQILLLRHGEKPDSGDELSPQGWARARALPALFHTRPEFQKFGLPVALFAMAQAHDDSSIRPIQTLKFVAEDLHLPILTPFPKGQEEDLARTIAQDHSLDGHLVVVCWEHKALSNLLSALGMDPAPIYPDDKFDRAWLLTMDGALIDSFQDLPQRLLPTDDPN